MKRLEFEFYLRYYVGKEQYSVSSCYVLKFNTSTLAIFDFGNGLKAVIDFSFDFDDWSNVFDSKNALNYYLVNYFSFDFPISKNMFISLLKKYSFIRS